jgi:hypothetical protein
MYEAMMDHAVPVKERCALVWRTAGMYRRITVPPGILDTKLHAKESKIKAKYQLACKKDKKRPRLTIKK